MKIKLVRAVVLGFCFVFMKQVHAFELATHAALTREAYLRSVLAPTPARTLPEKIEQLGLEDWFSALGSNYVDIGASANVIRNAEPFGFESFTANQIALANRRTGSIVSLPTIGGWLMLGSIREDDVPLDPLEGDNNPQDDPDGAFVRVVHHFFDPHGDRALSVVPWSQPAPKWAIDSRDIPLLRRGNHFNIDRAKRAMWRAATLRNEDGVSDLDFVETLDIAGREALRKAYWATVFRSLGDAVHLLQDMAQPQHTRDDPHAGLGCITSAICALGHASYFEQYVESRIIGRASFVLREGFSTRGVLPPNTEILRPAPIDFGQYPQPFDFPQNTFNAYSDFFADKTGPSSLDGKGLANFSNQAFYTVGSNLGATSYPSPSKMRSGLVSERIPNGKVVNANGVPVVGALDLVMGTVRDNLNPVLLSESGVPLSSIGAFDQFLRPGEASSGRTVLTHYNYAHQARMLVPRAVAYSKELLNYFFRGALEITVPDEGAYAIADFGGQGCGTLCGFDRVKLKIRTPSAAPVVGSGVAVAVVKFRRNTCHARDLSGEPGGAGFKGDVCREPYEDIVVSEPVAIGGVGSIERLPLTFRFSGSRVVPFNATDIWLQVVFKGLIGSEQDAVVVATKNISEPNYFAIQNNTDYRYSPTTDTYSPVAPGLAQTFTQLELTIGGAPKPIATLPQLPAAAFAQVAFLTDLGKRKLKINMYPGSLAMTFPMSWERESTQFYLPKSGSGYVSSEPVSKVRGMYRGSIWAFDATGQPTLAFCEAGSSREYCTESTLTPLTSANARPWTIHFPAVPPLSVASGETLH